MSNASESPPPGGQFLVYQTQDGKLKIDVHFEGELRADSVVKESLTTVAHAGRISHDDALVKAEVEYEKSKALTAGDARPVDTDFDQATNSLPMLPRQKQAKPRKP